MAASVVAVEHPRIYFPREIKREYHNSTITSPESSSSTPDVTTTTDPSTTKRDLLSDLISEILGTEWPPKSSTSEKPKPPVTTVIVDSTVVVGGPSSGSGLPKVTVLPTTKKTESKKKSGTRTRSSTESGIVIGPTGIVSSSPSSEPTGVTSVDPPVGNSTVSESTTTSKTGGGILDPIGTLLSSLLPIPEPTSKSTSSPEQPISQNSTTSAAPTESKSGLLPPLTSLLPIGGSTTTSDYGSLPNATSTDVPVTTTTSSGPAITNVPTTTTDIPVGNTTSTTTGTISTPTVTDIPVTNGTVSVPPTGTATTSTISGDNSTVIVVPSTTSQPTLIPTTTSETVTPSTTTDAGVTSIRPTATLTNTNNWLPTTIVIEPTTFSFSSPTASPTETTSQGLPTTIPKVINPDNPTKPAPSGTVPIQIGFTWQLNYVFVASNPTAASQIFQLLPRALSDASGVSVDKMQIYGLVPFNTQANWGYITTIANLSYPATLVDTLQMDLWTPNSAVYNNADPMVRNLTSFINIQIDLHGNINSGGAPGSGGSGGNGGNNNNNNNDAFGSGNNQGDQNSKQKATTAGIAVAAVGLSAAYGAAMFIVARRYKRKRQGHRRASSITSSPASSEMRYHGNGSPALMGGALMSRDTSTYGGAGGRDSHASGGHSARTAGISAPVATENSLGWN
ncbi:basic proline-rich protein [Pochonia chlamydosporia 170]|uniref:Basic proline-rich protein n=1 Tax=Pochonia chlamydosporia 170 TaxID=1380566 RepID=A0A179FRW9_METCM|nr:basic proline-rich protein [Pochonia chlamydosporia 170]OAQ67881.1 basic proline-rich protein [Pochonia chlamydosporia 170]